MSRKWQHHFYPFYTLAKVGGQCVWEFGNMHNGNSFGGDQQYAHLVEHGFFKGQFERGAAQPEEVLR